MPRSVTIIQRILPAYRMAFFNQLYTTLAGHDVCLSLIYGQQKLGAVPDSVLLDLPWATRIENRYLTIANKEVVWQPLPALKKNADLLIIEQSTRLLVNYPLLARRRIKGKGRLAFWGHGRNFQTSGSKNYSEKRKWHLNNFVDWWFAYTDLSAEVVSEMGFPSDRITTVQNAIDDAELRNALDQATEEDCNNLRSLLGIQGNSVGIFCGGMYPDKQLTFLISACNRVKERLPEFEVIFIGSGPDENIIRDAIQSFPWMKYVGPIHGGKRAIYFKISELLLLPGVIGLSIVDSFVARIPLITTDTDGHGPEISYLNHGVNGWMTTKNVDVYAEAVVRILKDRPLLNQLRDGCVLSAKTYTLDAMVSRFAQGVVECLDRPKR